jgi:hypothetical protein
MSRSKKAASVAFTGAAAVAAFGFQAGHALATAGTWHIQAPKGTPYHGAFEATLTGAAFELVDVSQPDFPAECIFATASGSIAHSTITGTTTTTTIGKVKTANVSGCSYTAGQFKVNLTANLGGTSYQASTEIAKGKIANVHAVMSGIGTWSCHATITGSLSAYYNNATHHLVLGHEHKATLTIHSPNVGCLILGNGDKAYIAGTYNVTTPKSLFVSGPA